MINKYFDIILIYNYQDIEASTMEISSVYSTYSASFGADGDPETFFHTKAHELTPWWKAELNGEFWISALVITNRGTGCIDQTECGNV